MKAALPRVYFDSNVFISAMENATAHSDHAWWVLDAIQSGEIAGVTSEITLAEVLVKPIEHGTLDMKGAYERMIAAGPNFEVLPVRREVLIEAATIRATRSSIKLPDAVHLATARILACAFFVTEDDRLHVPEGIKRLPVNPFTLDDILAEWNDR